jgi:hypothetical protein
MQDLTLFLKNVRNLQEEEETKDCIWYVAKKQPLLHARTVTLLRHSVKRVFRHHTCCNRRMSFCWIQCSSSQSPFKGPTTLHPPRFLVVLLWDHC